ncbi:CocE/NonD family hydrolase C-terminal non-catalytic domain-containing protein [Mesorhizobium sp. M0571]
MSQDFRAGHRLRLDISSSNFPKVGVIRIPARRPGR